MKVFKYFAVALVLVSLVSCQKHAIKYDTDFLGSKDAEFQLHYFEPVPRSGSTYYIDSVFVNDVLYSSVNGSGQLQQYNGVPGGSAGRFFAANSGTVKFTFWRGGKVVYDQTATLMKGKQNVFVIDLNQPPVIIENGYPYKRDWYGKPTAATWGTDSVQTVRFFNFMYEKKGEPYPGKLQYQWHNGEDYDADGNVIWHNVGSPVGFGEASERVPMIVHKTTFNSGGTDRIDYRILDENGKVLQTVNSSGVMKNYTDYWTATIGRSVSHIWAGIRTSSNPYAYVSQWWNQ